MQKKEYACSSAGQAYTATFTDLTDQAQGSTLLRLGDSLVLATAVMSADPREGMGYFPLTIDYEERYYAAGAILGSRFQRREGRPSDDAVLSGRIVDRTMRPLFDQRMRNDVQVVITILALGDYDPDILAVNAASIALATSSIPWNGPVSAVRIGKIKGQDTCIINPTYDQRASDDYIFDLVACGKDGNINMIEVGSHEVAEAEIAQALETASTAIEEIQAFQHTIIKEIGKEKVVFTPPEAPKEMTELFEREITPKLTETVLGGPGKGTIKKLHKEWHALVEEHLSEMEFSKALIDDHYDEAINTEIHRLAIEEGKRADGRAFDEVRGLYAQAGGLSPVLHGAGIFYRGGTHILSALTLGGPQDAQLVEGMEYQGKKTFFHHYNFPPYSAGETGRVGGFNRRQIGHGALAEKALRPVLPDIEDFPYTIRIVSESMASNGSTSMGSVCGSTLALMDAGVPITEPVAGIASGLMMENKEKYALITDIQGPEDEHGDMDFKVAGTKNGVTAIQMDVKVEGIPIPILTEALEHAKQARLHILETMLKEISEPRAELSPNAPKIVTMTIKPDQIGLVIGSGGKTIKEIKEKTNTEIEIEEDGTIFITGKGEGPEKTRAIIEELTYEMQVGDRAKGTIVKTTDFGAFVRVGQQEGLVHISEFAPWRVEKVSDLVKRGMEVPVLVKEVSPEGKISLSIKACDPEFFKKSE